MSNLPKNAPLDSIIECLCIGREEITDLKYSCLTDEVIIRLKHDSGLQKDVESLFRRRQLSGS